MKYEPAWATGRRDQRQAWFVAALTWTDYGWTATG